MKQVFILLLAIGISNSSIAQGIFSTATFDTIANSLFPYSLDQPRDLDFHPTSTDTFELWVLNRGTASAGSSVTIISNAGQDSAQSGQRKKDSNARHFMCFATGLAFAENGNWANSPGIADANRGSAGPPGFTGPALWSGDLSVFAVPCGGCNGSHLDPCSAA